MDRMRAARSPPAARPASGPTRSGSLQRKGRLLEKLEEAPWLTLVHGRGKRRAHPNLIEINAFVARAGFEYGSTSIMETL
jgi:hypothetical protein